MTTNSNLDDDQDEPTVPLGVFINMQRAKLTQERANAHASVDAQFDLLEQSMEADFRLIVEGLLCESAHPLQ